MAKGRKLPNWDGSARRKDEMLGCDDVLEGRRLPGDAWYSGAVLLDGLKAALTCLVLR